MQTTVGWIFWYPGAIARYRAEGLPAAMAGPLGYLAARCAPLAGAGPKATGWRYREAPNINQHREYANQSHLGLP